MQKILIYGDSLSTGTHGQGGYLAALQSAFGAPRLVNCAVGSSGCAAGTPNSMAEVLRQDAPEAYGADLVLIWHGSNDWYWGTPLGRPGVADPATFYGAVGSAVDTVRLRNPGALVVWATPIYRFEQPCGGTQPGCADFTQNRAGQTLPDYTAALRRAADCWHFPLIEMGRLCGICAQNEGALLEDHVHPNAAGYRRIERVLCPALRYYHALHTGEETCHVDTGR